MNYSPINTPDGCIVIPAGSGWRQLPFPGAELDTIPVSIPLEAQAAVIYARSEVVITMSPQAIGNNGFTMLGEGCVLPIYDRTQLQQLVFSADSECVIQFFTGSTGLLPVPTPAVVPSGGGGGGGGVTAVNGAYPITSTGGSSPTIGLTAAATRQMLQWKDGAWHLRNTQVAKTVFVDATYGTAAGERENPLLPFKTIVQAQAVALAGDLIMVRPGTYNETAGSLGKHLVTYWLDAAEVHGNWFDNPGGYTVVVEGTGKLYPKPLENRVVQLAHVTSDLTVNVPIAGEMNLNGGTFTSGLIVSGNAALLRGTWNVTKATTIGTFTQTGGTLLANAAITAQSSFASSGAIRMNGNLTVGAMALESNRVEIIGAVRADTLAADSAALLSITGPLTVLGALEVNHGSSYIYVCGQVQALSIINYGNVEIMGPVLVQYDVSNYGTLHIAGDITSQSNTAFGSYGEDATALLEGTVRSASPTPRTVKARAGITTINGLVRGGVEVGNSGGDAYPATITINGTVDFYGFPPVMFRSSSSGQVLKLVLIAGARLIAGTSTYSIRTTGPETPTVVAYGGFSDKPEEPTVGVTGLWTVDPYVTYP